MGFSVVIPTSATLNATVDGEAVLAAITGANATLTASVAIPGPTGPIGPTGPSGAGIIPGGTAGQVLSKIDSADYNTQWSDPAVFTGGEVANPITMQDGSSDSEMAASFFGVELTSDNTQNASLSYGGLNVQISGSAMNVTATGVTFPDSTTQSTSATNLGYINQTTADGLYYGINNPSSFVDGTYVSSVLTGYATETYVSSQGFITRGTADSLYYAIGNPSGFVDSTYVNGQGFITSSALTGYATESFVTSQGFITQTTADGLYYPLSTNPSGFLTDATSDGQTYGRNNGLWVTVNEYTGGPLASDSTWTAGNQTTTAGAGAVSIVNTDGRNFVTDVDHLAITDAVSNTVSVSPAGITFTNTTTWAGIVFPDATIQTTAYTGGGPFLPLSGGTMTGAIVFDGTSGQYINKGNFDTSRGGNYGISLVCSIGYEFNWQAGWLRTTEQGSTTPRPLYLDSGAGTTLRSWNSGDNTGIEVSHTAITFPDSSTQTVAFPGFAGYAPLASPALTGTPTAPTATLGDDSTQIATTAFVQDAVISGSAHAETLQATVRNNTGSTLASFTLVYISGAVGNRAAVAKAQANSEAASYGTFAVTESSIANNADGIVISAGVLSNVNTSAFADGDKLYLSPTVAGGVTTTKPSAPNHLVYVGVVTRSHPTLGTVSVRIQNGYELEELHNVAIASVADKDLLAYETSTTLWKNKSFSTLGLATLSGPTFTGVPAAPTASVSTNTTQLATTAFVVGQVGTATPLVNGTAAVGTSLLYARQDHVHGTDTSRAALSSPTFTGVPAAPTASVGTNTTQLATTAFVLANAGSPTFATNAQAKSATSTTVAMTPMANRWATNSQNVVKPFRANFTATITGTITGYNSQISSWFRLGTAAACSLKNRNYGNTQTDQTYFFETKNNPNAYQNFSKPRLLSGRTFFNTYPTIASATMVTWAFYHGKAEGDSLGDLTRRGMGWKYTGGTAPQYIVFQIHDGTTLTNITTTYSPTTLVGFDWDIESDGAGNAVMYINGSAVATATGTAPTGAVNLTPTIWQEEFVASSAPPGNCDVCHSRGTITIID